MRVLDISDNKLFCDACRELAGIVSESDFKPDLIVAIATGGQVMLSEVQPLLDIASVTVRRQRMATTSKSRLKGLLAILPMWLKNALRLLESFVRELLFEIKKRKICNSGIFDVGLSIPQVLLESGEITDITNASKILIIDDAVDSGGTLDDVYHFVLRINPQAQIRSAVLTMTFKNPQIHPNYYLWQRVLLRFPWSLDS